MTNRGVGKATELGLFCEVYSFSSKLELDGTRYSTDSWAELVIKDKRYDTKLFAKTKLRLIDITETLGQYRKLFNQISTNPLPVAETQRCMKSRTGRQ